MNSKFPLSRPLEPGETVELTDLYFFAGDPAAGWHEVQPSARNCAGLKVGQMSGDCARCQFRRPVKREAGPVSPSDGCPHTDLEAAEGIFCKGCGVRMLTVPAAFRDKLYMPAPPELAALDYLRVCQLAAISVACQANTEESAKEHSLARDHEWWSPAYADAVAAVGREMIWRKIAEAKDRETFSLKVALTFLAIGFMLVVLSHFL